MSLLTDLDRLRVRIETPYCSSWSVSILRFRGGVEPDAMAMPRLRPVTAWKDGTAYARSHESLSMAVHPIRQVRCESGATQGLSLHVPGMDTQTWPLAQSVCETSRTNFRSRLHGTRTSRPELDPVSNLIYFAVCACESRYHPDDTRWTPHILAPLSCPWKKGADAAHRSKTYNYGHRSTEVVKGKEYIKREYDLSKSSRSDTDRTLAHSWG